MRHQQLYWAQLPQRQHMSWAGGGRGAQLVGGREKGCLGGSPWGLGGGAHHSCLEALDRGSVPSWLP